MSKLLQKPIEFVKGVGPTKGKFLIQDLSIRNVEDLLFTFPFRYVDKTNYTTIKDIGRDGEKVLLKAKITSVKEVKGKRQQRLSAIAKDDTGYIELLWFKGVSWVKKMIIPDQDYIIYGRLSIFKGKKTLAHPELERIKSETASLKTKLDAVYSSSEQLTKLGLDNKGRRKLITTVFDELKESDIPETLPPYLTQRLKLRSRYEALLKIHQPKNREEVTESIARLKFEEIFFFQLAMLFSKQRRKLKYKGPSFTEIGETFNNFYNNNLPFELTNAQKRVVKEIRSDVGSGYQMNRLLQGDVGSGKTMVALLTMLIAIDNGYQAVMLAPTQILAQQHYDSLKEYLEGTGVRVGYLSGAVKGKERKIVLDYLKNGELNIIVGTHALLEDYVVFQKLGIAVIDEQHRFGVMQRAKLWNKNPDFIPHILVMTATPIPRTLAMTAYGDLDVSVIDELPPGRKQVKTLHMTESKRYKVIQFIREEIAKGRQIYIVYPLIEESETLDLQNLQTGYEEIRDIFKPPEFQISVVHGRLKPADKDLEMKRFVDKRTQIMVATTVIEVGVNVPNASVMIIENTERFGLSQLHQLRGRVGRGAEQSYCILMSGNKLSAEGKERIHTMVSTTDGFKIAEADLRLRGPGDLMGTQQSGVMRFQLLSLIEDRNVLTTARNVAKTVLDNDPNLEHPDNAILRKSLKVYFEKHKDWGRIS